MSLVLEALKKLEREKEKDERGFVVMAATPWPSRAARLWPAWVGLGIAVGAALTFLFLRAPRPEATPVTATRAGVSEAQLAPPAAVPMATLAPRRPAVVRTAPAPAAAESAAAAAGAARAEETRSSSRDEAAPAAPPDHGLRLQAVSERDGQPVAIISDRLVRVGDEFDGVRVLAIRLDEVEVEVGGRRSILRF